MKVSVIVPVFNEESVIGNCLGSLQRQEKVQFEIIVVDDGSTDKTREVISTFPVKLLRQDHLGPGLARNLGARHAAGAILVFVDADMEFDPLFLFNLIDPIDHKKVIGTFSKEEYVLNKDNIWSQCWNINKGLPLHKMHPEHYPDTQPVFRAILKKEFLRAGGFGAIGYVDDHTLSDVLQQPAVAAPGAIFYHRNPDNLKEIYQQARWIGKSEYKRRKVQSQSLMRVLSLLRYSLPFSLWHGIKNAVLFVRPQFLVFKLVYDLGIEISLLKSFIHEQQYR